MIINKALALARGEPRDDMAVICARVDLQSRLRRLLRGPTGLYWMVPAQPSALAFGNAARNERDGAGSYDKDGERGGRETGI